MTTVRPLTLDLLRSDWTAEVPSPPHDALNPSQRRLHLERFPMSYLGVTRSPDDSDDPSVTTADLLVAGRQALERLVAADVFEPAGEPTFHLYRLSEHGRIQTGVVCGVAVADYEEGHVRIHERVRYDRVEHLSNHLGVVGVQSSPIAMACRRADAALAELLAVATVEAEPELDFVTSDGLRQQVWRVVDPSVIAELNSILSADDLYLIDGHHRAAAAAHHRQIALQQNEVRPGDHWMLSTIFPASEMHNKAFHRIVDPAAAQVLSDCLEELGGRRVASVGALADRGAMEVGVGFALDDGSMQWAVLPADDRPGTAPAANGTVDDEPIHDLDSARLGRNILRPVLGIDEAHAGDRLRYQPAPAEGSDTAADYDMKAGEAVFILRPVTMQQLFAVADSGLVMPPKSTYFEPKVRSGLFVHHKTDV